MNSVVSQKQVLIDCSSVEEAQNLVKALLNIPMDTLDDVLNVLPALKEEVGNLKKENEELNKSLEEFQNDVAELSKENLKLKAKLEKPLGSSKKGKK